MTKSTLGFASVIFDMDGVVTRTAKVHAAAWKELFDDFLQRRAERHDEDFSPFDVGHDYLAYVDGKPRYEGVRSFLGSRGIELPSGEPADGPDKDTVCGLGNRKDRLFEQRLHSDGVTVFESTISLIKALRAEGVKIGMVTSSKHSGEILAIAGTTSLFDARIDGGVAECLGLEGKPNPDIFSKCAQMLQVENAASVVVEDAVSGVEAGRKGGFGLVIGIDRGGNREALEKAGADAVVSDLAEVSLEDIDALFSAKMSSQR